MLQAHIACVMMGYVGIPQCLQLLARTKTMQSYRCWCCCRYKWLAEEMGKRFATIYDLQRSGQAFDTPQQLWEALGLYNVTQQNAADYMQVCAATF
jgi:hypothetical protein